MISSTPSCARKLGLIDRRDSAIDRHDQRRLALLGEPAQGLGIDAIALLDAMRNVVLELGGAGQPQARPQHARAAHAVDVVVAVNHDLPALTNRPHDPLGRLHGAGQQLRVVKDAQLGFQKGVRPIWVFDSAVDQQLGDQRRKPRPPAQDSRCARHRGA